jgi:hypothetical protein
MGAKYNQRMVRKKATLFAEQNGRCHWCRGAMVMPDPEIPPERHPHNMATIEHLRDRWHPLRSEPNNSNQRRLVAACKRCNERRGNRSNIKALSRRTSLRSSLSNQQHGDTVQSCRP